VDAGSASGLGPLVDHPAVNHQVFDGRVRGDDGDFVGSAGAGRLGKDSDACRGVAEIGSADQAEFQVVFAQVSLEVQERSSWPVIDGSDALSLAGGLVSRDGRRGCARG
jgi:hypothetical protein